MRRAGKILSAVGIAGAMSASVDVCRAQIAETWTISDDVTVEATNTAADISVVAESGTLMSAPAIADGSRNTISASAIGASAAISHSSTSTQDTAIAGTIDGATTISAINLGGAVTVSGAIDGALIEQGHDNTIAASAVGASAQFAVTDSVLEGAAMDRALAVNGDVTVYAENAGAVTVGTDVGTNGDGPQITGGIRNAFTVSAVGASAGVSTLAVVDGGTYTADIALGVDSQISVTALNRGDVTLGSTDDPASSATLSGATLGPDSIDGTISFNAVGASGALTSTTLIYAGSADANVAFGDVSFDIENTGNVSANVSISDVSVDGRNSISTGAVGSSVSNSARVISYSGEGTATNGTIGAVTFQSVNAGSIIAVSGMSAPTIAGGIGLSISVAAVGASAGFALP